VPDFPRIRPTFQWGRASRSLKCLSVSGRRLLVGRTFSTGSVLVSLWAEIQHFPSGAMRAQCEFLAANCASRMFRSVHAAEILVQEPQHRLRQLRF
jgi:hypothetical protein